jgi:hypothetical protein
MQESSELGNIKAKEFLIKNDLLFFNGDFE